MSNCVQKIQEIGKRSESMEFLVLCKIDTKYHKHEILVWSKYICDNIYQSELLIFYLNVIPNQQMSGREKNKVIALSNVTQRAKRSCISDTKSSGHGICAEIDEILKTVSTHFSVNFRTFNL